MATGAWRLVAYELYWLVIAVRLEGTLGADLSLFRAPDIFQLAGTGY